MPTTVRNIVSIIQKRERGTSVRFTSNIELQKVAEERAALAEMQEIHCKLPSSVRSTFLTSFSPDSTKVASTHGDHKIYVCDVKTGKLLHKLEGHPRTPWCLAFHPTSNDILASGCLGGEVRVWHLHGGSEKWRGYHNTVITSLAFHPLDKVLVIATFNEIHFWDWSLPEPFASCSTSSVNEKVRFVKFDQLGNRLITGILNVQDIYHSSSSGENTTRNQARSTSSDSQSSGSTLSHRRSLLTRLMNMYQHIERMDELSRLTDGLGQAQEEALSQARQYAENTTQATRLQRQLQEPYLPDPVPLEPSTSQPRPQNSGSTSEGSNESRELLDSHEEFLVRAFWRTFYRLRSICTTLERRMLQLQHHSSPQSTWQEPRPNTPTPGDRSMLSSEPVIDRIRSATNDVATNTRASYRQVTSNYLINVLTRLQNSLQFSSLTNAVAQEQIQQLQFRISEILDRLTNVTGYRARLTTLRDQIFEVAERTERRGGETSSSRRLDLAHCLWLVEMSLQLTQQMQRILQADYRLTQLHINSSSQRSATRSSPSNSGASTSSGSTGSSATPPANVRSCIACGNQNPAADAGSSEEFDQAWDRLRIVVRRELETLTERFRSNIFNDTNLMSSQSTDGEGQPESLGSSTWQSVLQPLAEHPILQRSVVDNENIESSRSSRLLDDHEGRRAIPGQSVYARAPRRHRHASYGRNARSTSVPSRTQSNSGQSSNFFVPEIHVVPSASEDVEPPNLLPIHERPRSPPLPTILSGSNDPLLTTWFQTIYDAGTRSRFGGEVSSGFLHRIQCWDFSKYDIPSINNAKANVVVHHCKIHNDASVDISKDGEMLVALLPSASSIAADSLVFAVFSLKPTNLGQLLLVSDFDCNAISVSFSPLSQYIVVGLATPRMYMSSNEKQAVAQIFELKYAGKILIYNHVRSLMQDGIAGVNSQSVSLNSVQWLPEPGQGLIYGTNRGCLCICKPVSPMNAKVNNLHLGPRPRYYSTLLSHRMFSTSTQTSEPEMHTTGTQTFGEGSSATSR